MVFTSCQKQKPKFSPLYQKLIGNGEMLRTVDYYRAEVGLGDYGFTIYSPDWQEIEIEDLNGRMTEIWRFLPDGRLYDWRIFRIEDRSIGRWVAIYDSIKVPTEFFKIQPERRADKPVEYSVTLLPRSHRNAVSLQEDANKLVAKLALPAK